MSGSLQDIQLKIILETRGLESVNATNSALRGMHKTMGEVFKASELNRHSDEQRAKGMSGLLQKINEAEHKYDALYRASYRLKQAGQDLIDIGMGGIGMLSKAVSAWGDYEFALNRAAGAMSVPDKLLPRLSDAILDVAKNVRLYKPEEVAKATYYWASTTGQQVKSMKDLKVAMAGVTPILKAAALTETDMESAIKGVYAILVQYHLPLTKTTDITEKLMLVTQRTALEFPDLINSFKMVGPVARASGMSFEQVATAIGMIGDAGIKGTMSGRALRQFFIQLVKPSDKAKKALDRVFNSTFHMKNAYQKLVFPKGKFIGLAKYVGRLADVTKGMTQQQRNSFLATITTANELPVLQSLLQHEIELRRGIIKATDDQKYSLAGAHKAFEDSFGKLANSWKGLVGLLQNTFMPIVLQVGKAVADMAKPVIEWFSKILTGIAEWMKKNPQLVDFIVKVIAIASAIAVAIGAALVFVGTLMSIAAGIGFVISAFGGFVAPVLAVVGIVAAFAKAVIDNTHGIRDAIVAFAKAFGNFISRLIGNTDDAKAQFGGLLDTLKQFGLLVLDKVVDALKFLTDVLNNLSDEDIQHIKDLALGIIALVVANKGLHIVASGLDSVAGAVRSVAGVINTVKTVGGFLTALPGGLGAAMTAIRGVAAAFGLLNLALGPIGWLILGIGAAIAAFVVAYETNFGGFRDFVDGIVSWFMTNVVPAIQGFITAVGSFVSGVVTAVTGFVNTVITTFNNVVAWFQNLPANIGKFIDEVVKNIQGFVDTVFKAIAAFLTDLSQHWSYYLGYIIGTIIGFIAKVIINVIKFGVDFIAAAVDFLSKLPGRFADWLGQTWNTLQAWWWKTVIAVGDRARDMVLAVIDWVSKLPGRIADWLGSTWTSISGWFGTTIPKVAAKAGDLVDSIINWLKRLPGMALQAIAQLPTFLRNFLNDVPPRLANAVIGIGRDIVEGVWTGIQRMWSWLVNHVTGFFQGIIDGVKNQLGIHSPSTVFADMGTNLIRGLAVGIQKTSDAHEAMRKTTDSLIAMAEAGAADLGSALNAELATPGNFSVTKDSTKVIRLEVAVTSPDGSVKQLDTQQIAGLLNGSELIRAIEHMASVE